MEICIINEIEIIDKKAIDMKKMRYFAEHIQDLINHASNMYKFENVDFKDVFAMAIEDLRQIKCKIIYIGDNNE